MLTGVSLENFKCFEKIEIENLSDITILSGKNNMGKSAIVQAIVLLKESISGGIIAWEGVNLGSFEETVYQHEIIKRQIKISCTFKLTQSEEDFLIETLNNSLRDILNGTKLDTNIKLDKIKYTVVINFNGIYNETFLTEYGKPILSLIYGSEPKIILHLSTFSSISDKEMGNAGYNNCPFGMISSGNNPLFDTLQYIIKNIFDLIYYISPSREIVEWRSSLGKRPEDVGINGIYSSALLHYIYSDRDEGYNSIEKWLKEFDDEITMLKSPLRDGEAEIKLETKITDVNIVTTGTGLKTVFPLVVQSMISQPNSIILVEEPEIHLHRGAQKTLLNLFLELTKKDKQIIFTTHSWDIFVELYKMVKQGKITEDNISRFDIRLENGKRVAKQTPIFDEVHKKWLDELKETLG